MGKRSEKEKRTLNGVESKWWKAFVKPLMRGDQDEAEAQFLHVLDMARRKKLPKWTPFQKATVIESSGMSAKLPMSDGGVTYVNSRYQVTVYPPVENEGVGRIVHLSFKSNENDAYHDWRDMQRIKNELVGPEYEAVEIFPAESRLVDTANQYHLWVFLDAPIPFGMGQPTETGEHRRVDDSADGFSRQRPFEEPTDLKPFTSEDFQNYSRKNPS